MVFWDVFSCYATVPSGPGSPHYWGITITLKTLHTRSDLSGRVISPSQRTLPDNTKHSQQTDIHALSGIRTHKPRNRAVADLRLRTRGHWNRRSTSTNRYQSFGRKQRLILHFKGSLTLNVTAVGSLVSWYIFTDNTTLHPKIQSRDVKGYGITSFHFPTKHLTVRNILHWQISTETKRKSLCLLH